MEKKYSFENLDRYDLKDGHIYKYTVSEDQVVGYTSKQMEMTSQIQLSKIQPKKVKVTKHG